MSKSNYLILYIAVACAVLLSEKCYAQKYALLIGVDYPAPNTLDYTRADAIQFGNVLERNFGFQIKTLTTPEETTRTRLMREFENLKKDPYDQVIVFFSGHGIQDPNSKEVGYLLPYDGNSNKLLDTAIDMSIFQNLSKTIKAKQILFIIDTCYSGIIGSYSNMDIAGGDSLLSSRQIMTAGRSSETARMYPTKELSLYTYYLIKALDYNHDAETKKITADYDKDDELTAWDLQTYVEKKISKETQEEQNPRIYNYTENDGIFLFQAIWKENTVSGQQTTSYSKKKNYENKYIEGELSTAKLFIGGGTSLIYLDGEFRPGCLINFEILYPEISKLLKGVAPSIEFGYILWEEDGSYPTLPGHEVTFIEKENAYFVNTVTKKYFEIYNDIYGYCGGAIGWSVERKDEGRDDFIWNGFLGVILYPWNIRTAIELRYFSVAIQEKNVQFNMLGNTEPDFYSRRYNALSLNVNLSKAL